MKNQPEFMVGPRKLMGVALLIAVTVIMTGCFGSKPVSYFENGVLDTNRIDKLAIPDQTIQKGDILNIIVYSDNPEATSIYNQAGGSQVVSSMATASSKGISPTNSSNTGGGYLVDNEGNIIMHAIGVLHAEGKTKNQLAAEIVGKLNKLAVLSNPYCVIRFSNFKISVLGEVRNPGVFTLAGEKTSVLEAMGMAGDITDYGQKDRVTLIREVDGQRMFYKINLLDPQVMNSPQFYLRQNDVLLVQADKKKPTAMDIQTLSYITVGATVVSSLAILITLFK